MTQVTKPPKTLRQKLIRWCLYFCYLSALLWFSVKLFWRQQAGVPLTGKADVSHIWQFFYPELRSSGVLDDLEGSAAQQDESQNRFRILLLGGSVLEQVAPELHSSLADAVGRENYQLFNLCSSARTSRDSYLKYEYLLSRGFKCDLVIFYHGINDVRMNCCPPDQFRDDYTHCSFYKSFKRRRDAGTLNLTSVARDYIDNSIPLGEPDDEYREYGHDIKTRKPFEDNLRGILQLAKQHKQPAVVMTFASRIPDDYSRAKFEAKQLGYGSGQYEMVVESWGDPQAVRLGIRTHNQVIRSAAADLGVRLIDLDSLLKDDAAVFSDACHLSQTGLDRFVDQLLSVILKFVPQ